MTPEITFAASIHSVKADAEGEGTLVLKIPSTDQVAIAGLLGMTGKLLKVSVYEENKENI